MKKDSFGISSNELVLYKFIKKHQDINGFCQITYDELEKGTNLKGVKNVVYTLLKKGFLQRARITEKGKTFYQFKVLPLF